MKNIIALIFSFLFLALPAFAGPLHEAVNKGDIKLVRSLIKNGADVSAFDKKGRSALAIARKKKHKDIITLLELFFSKKVNPVKGFYDPYNVPSVPARELKDIYPNLARELKAEALVFVDLVISKNGSVLKVFVRKVKLNKTFPPDVRLKLHNAFSRDAITILSDMQYSPFVIEGKKVPVRVTFSLQFKLK